MIIRVPRSEKNSYYRYWLFFLILTEFMLQFNFEHLLCKDKTIPILKTSTSNHLPFHDVFLFGRESHADAEKFPAVGGVRFGVAAVIDLF